MEYCTQDGVWTEGELFITLLASRLTFWVPPPFIFKISTRTVTLRHLVNCQDRLCLLKQCSNMDRVEVCTCGCTAFTEVEVSTHICGAHAAQGLLHWGGQPCG
ncbi:hypothetical protein QTP86_028614, partial [Hemibagrus guttatus]